MTDFKNLTCFVRFSEGKGEGIKQNTNHRKKSAICSTFSNIGNLIKRGKFNELTRKKPSQFLKPYFIMKSFLKTYKVKFCSILT